MKKHLHILSLAAGALMLASCADTFPDNSRHERHRYNDRYNDLDQPPGVPDGATIPADPSTGLVVPPGTTLPPATPPPVVNPPVTTTPPPAAPQTNSIPYGKPIPGKKGFVTSPFDASAGMIDVRDIPSGTKVKDPYTGKVFLVP